MGAEIIATHENVDMLDRKVLQKRKIMATHGEMTLEFPRISSKNGPYDVENEFS